MSTPPPASLTRAAVLLLPWLTGVSIRAPILIAAPLGPRIAEALSLDQTNVGALTTLPVLALGLGAIPAAWLIARLGARNALHVFGLTVIMASGSITGALYFLLGLNIVCLPLAWTTITGLEAQRA